ncbi:MAG: hypothetical protein OEU26_10930 [Candidatus Tectomicrobia bacterium]|nr:hypothetical protein [Candidatus Tectomicrobia bacterium]
MPRPPTYASIVLDLHKYFKILVNTKNQSKEVAQSTATIARSLLSAMDKMKLEQAERQKQTPDKVGHKTPGAFDHMTAEEIYEVAERVSGGRLKLVG